jgi:hypothetical protein
MNVGNEKESAMDTIVEKLQMQAGKEHLELDRGEIFELLELAWCPLCCRDGGRGGNKDCGVETVPE